MDTIFSIVNAACCALISLVILGAILSPRVHDGIVIKIGLIGLAAGFGAIALLMWEGPSPTQVRGIERALLLINSGIAVVIVGFLWRRAVTHHPVRRTSDWADFDTNQTAERP